MGSLMAAQVWVNMWGLINNILLMRLDKIKKDYYKAFSQGQYVGSISLSTI